MNRCAKRKLPECQKFSGNLEKRREAFSTTPIRAKVNDPEAYEIGIIKSLNALVFQVLQQVFRFFMEALSASNDHCMAMGW